MGHIREIKCQIPHISPPTLSTSAKVAKQGAYMRDATVCKMSLKSPIYSVEIVLEGNNGFVLLLNEYTHKDYGYISTFVCIRYLPPIGQ